PDPVALSAGFRPDGAQGMVPGRSALVSAAVLNSLPGPAPLVGVLRRRALRDVPLPQSAHPQGLDRGREARVPDRPASVGHAGPGVLLLVFLCGAEAVSSDRGGNRVGRLLQCGLPLLRAAGFRRVDHAERAAGLVAPQAFRARLAGRLRAPWLAAPGS